ncbi:MAG: hypothetical protein WD826_06025 [Actinomycetota bacterium]
MQATLLDEITIGLAGDRRVDALWVAGSVGRGDGDALSDLDLVLVAAPGCEDELVDDRFELPKAFGPVALLLDSPQNAHVRGSQVNVIYDSDPLPLWVDWNVFPPMDSRPGDVRVMFEKREPDEVSGTMSDVFNTIPHREHAMSDDERRHFGVAMLPIIAKNALRGWPDAVAGLYGYIRQPPPPTYDAPTVIADLRQILERLGGPESPQTVTCIERYFDNAPKFVDGEIRGR